MISETLQKGLSQYSIGEKLRALRLKKKMGLVELGQHSGLSPALLSKIERGRLIPTLPTLLRISLVFSVGLEHFFQAATRPTLAVVRRAERRRFPETLDASTPGYFFESLDFPALERSMNAYFVEFEETASGLHAHGGAEFLYVIDGELLVSVGPEVHELAAGDSMYFDSSVTHRYQRRGGGPCRAIVVTAGQEP